MQITKLFVFLVAFTSSTILCLAYKQICYNDGVGCFSDEPPWDWMPLPQSPSEVAPIYVLYQKDKPPRVVKSWTEVKVNDLILLIHGLVDDPNTVFTWAPKIISQLHEVRPHTDVIFVNWAKGSHTSTGVNIYHQPAANTRVIAQMLALWLKASPIFDSTKAHCIGWSLGSHVCGLTAKRMGTKWGRLSALDPAGPGFATDDITARIDKSDAIAVDVMHMSAIGLRRQIGHKDFYVNAGILQPGCLTRRRRELTEPKQLHGLPDLANITKFIKDFFGCSHVRSVYLYAQTIVPKDNCKFQFCPCDSTLDFEKGKCKSCSPAVGALLGYRSIESSNTGNFYGVTTGVEPFCP